MTYMEEKIHIGASTIHRVLTIYNGLAVLLLAGFMAIMQQKINQSMWAHQFLQQVPGVPLPAETMLLNTLISFVVFTGCGYLYSHLTEISVMWRSGLFILELASCIFLMHSISLSYDGLVLLLVADLMYCYQGWNRLFIMLVAMLMIYGLISYNVSMLQPRVVGFDSYVGYYNHSVQSVLLSMKNMLVYGNIIIFVIYMAVLLQEKSQEAEEIASLNAQLVKTNRLLHDTNSQLNNSNGALYKANKKLREYAMTIASMTEIKERNRLAREIHDTLGHALTGIIAGLDASIVTMDYAPEATKEQLSKIRAAAQHGIKDVRRSMHMLRPEDLETLPLKEAVGKVVREFGETSGVKIQLQFDNFPEKLREDQTEVLYRIVQEALTNASRHGHATEVKIFMVQEKEKYPATKIIILTTFDDDEYVFNGLKYGASGYLLKGISVPDLTEAIRKVAAGEAMLNKDIVTKVVKLFAENSSLVQLGENVPEIISPAEQQERQSKFAIQVDELGVRELSKTERNIAKLVGRGFSNKEIAQYMKLSEGTVRNSLSTALSKLDLRDRTQLAIWTVQINMVQEKLE